MKYLAEFTHLLGKIWLYAVAVLTVIGLAAEFFQAPTTWEGIRLMQDKLSPFNLRYYFLLFIQFLPAVLAFRLSDYLKRKSESKASPSPGE